MFKPSAIPLYCNLPLDAGCEGVTVFDGMYIMIFHIVPSLAFVLSKQHQELLSLQMTLCKEFGSRVKTLSCDSGEDMEVSGNRDTPNHPNSSGIFHYKLNHLFSVPPPYGAPHMGISCSVSFPA